MLLVRVLFLHRETAPVDPGMAVLVQGARTVPTSVSDRWREAGPDAWEPLRRCLTAREGRLRRLLVDASRQVRVGALQLRPVDEPRAAVARLVTTWGVAAAPLAPELEKALRQAEEPRAVFHVQEALVAVGPAGLEVFGRLLHDPEPRLVRRALVGLTLLEGQAPWRWREVGAGLARDLAFQLTSSDSEILGAALRLLVRVDQGAEVGVPGALVHLEHPWSAIRHDAALLLGRHPPAEPGAVARLAARLGDSSMEVRCAAAEALGRFQERAAPAIPALREALHSESEALVIRATKALGRMGTPAQSAAPELLQNLRHDSPLVRAVSAGTLGRLRPPGAEVIHALAVAVGDADETVRREAAQALRNFGAEAGRVLSALTNALRDPSESVRVAAVEALGAIGPGARAALPQLQAARNNNQSVMNRPVLAAVALIERDPPPGGDHTLLAPEASGR